MTYLYKKKYLSLNCSLPLLSITLFPKTWKIILIFSYLILVHKRVDCGGKSSLVCDCMCNVINFSIGINIFFILAMDSFSPTFLFWVLGTWRKKVGRRTSDPLESTNNQFRGRKMRKLRERNDFLLK